MFFSKSIQGFTSFDLLTTVSSVVAVVAVSVPIVNRGVDSRNSDLARVQVKRLAEQLEANVAPLYQTGTRQLASAQNGEASLGLDPWGRPYRSKLVSNSYGQPSALLVYSAGPDGSVQSEEDLVKVAQGADFAFRGDDIGIIKSLR